MIHPRYLPRDAYIDDPAEKLDPDDPAQTARDAMFSVASALLIRLHEWITRGRNQVTDRAFRTDMVLLYISPYLLNCQHPTAAWVARQHGVTRQRASDVGIAFSKEFADYLQFRGQRFLNRRKRYREPTLEFNRPRIHSNRVNSYFRLESRRVFFLLIVVDCGLFSPL